MQLILSDTDVERIATAVAARFPMQQTAADEWLTVPQAAEHLKCSVSRIYHGTSARTLPFHREGGRLMFSRRELDDHIRNR